MYVLMINSNVSDSWLLPWHIC